MLTMYMRSPKCDYRIKWPHINILTKKECKKHTRTIPQYLRVKTKSMERLKQL